MILKNINKIREHPCESVSINNRSKSLCLCAFVAYFRIAGICRKR